MGILFLIYGWLICPAAFGILWAALSKGRISGPAGIFSSGCITALGLYCAAEIMLRHIWDIDVGKSVFIIMTVPFLAAAVIVFILNKNLWGYIKERLSLQVWICIGLALLCGLVSVLLINPDAGDDTAAVMSVNAESGTYYSLAPYTKFANDIQTVQDNLNSPLEIYYDLFRKSLGMDAYPFVRKLLPVFLLLLFFSIVWEYAKEFFKTEGGRAAFFIITLMLFMAQTPFEYFDGTVQAFRNIWMDKTMMYCIVSPFIFLMCVKFVKKPNIFLMLSALFAAGAAQLTVSHGFLWGLVMIISALMAAGLVKLVQRKGNVHVH